MIRLALLLMACALPSTLHAAEGALYVSPERGAYEVGDVFEVRIVADTDGDSITAAEAELSFDTRTLRLKELSTAGSILSSFATEPTFSNTSGKMRLSGWVGNTAYEGSQGVLVTAVFEALSPGSGALTILSGSLLSRDDLSSNVVTSLRSGAYRIDPMRIAQRAPTSTLALGEPKVAGASIEQPVILMHPGTMEEGDRLVIKGQASPNARMNVVYARGDEVPVRMSVLASSEGSFTFATDEGISAGEYRVWSEVALQGAEPLRSEPISVSVVADRTTIVALAGLTRASVHYWGVGLVVAATLLFLLRRRRRTRDA